MNTGSFLEKAKEFLGERQIIADREGMAHFDYDATEQHFMPNVVVLPQDAGQVSRIMKLAYEFDVPVTPQGGRTGLSGGGLPVRGGVVLSLIRMKRIIEIDEKNMVAVVEPGVVSNDLQEELKKYNLFFPPDPSSTVESTLGGNVAENAGYTRAVKYGVTRDYVTGIEAVLPTGEILNLGGKTVKNVSGYDLISLIVGSEGTLAIITKIIFKLLPRPLMRRTILVYLDSVTGAAELIVRVFSSGIVPSAMEIMDNMAINAVSDYLNVPLKRKAEALVLIEVDGQTVDAVREEAGKIFASLGTMPGVVEKRLVEGTEEADRAWRVRREALPALKAMGKDHLEADVVVPRYQLPFLVKAIRDISPGGPLSVVTYGHAGDGNLHVTILYRRRNFAELDQAYRILGEVYEKALGMGGTLTGEHGVGVTVKDYLSMQKSEAEIALMRRIKHAFDPKGLLNPGKIFD